MSEFINSLILNIKVEYSLFYTDMQEIAALFDACVYAVASAGSGSSAVAKNLFIYMQFALRYTADVFPDLPDGFAVRVEDECTCIEWVLPKNDVEKLSPWEYMLIYDDALTALHDWIRDIHDRKIYAVWQLAGFL